MPDLGSTPRDVYVGLSVSHTEPSNTHPDSGYSNPTGNPAELQYRPPAPAPQTAPEAPPSSVPGTPEPAGGLVGAAPQKRRRPEAGPPDRRRVANQPAATPVARHPASGKAPAPRTSAPVADNHAEATPAAPAPAEPRAQERSAVKTRDRSRSESRALRIQAADATNRPDPRRSREVQVDPTARPGPRELPAVRTTREVTRPLGRADDVPGILLVGLSALVVLGLGAVAIWALHPRGSPPASRLAADGPQWVPPGLGLEARSRDLLIEAELQEMIAEDRARRVAREAAHIRSGPG